MAKIKPVRVNLSTKADEIIATMREEIPSAMYHFRKPYGGRRKYMKFEGELLDKAIAEKESQMTDLNEYISQVGNRWMTYTMVDYYPKSQYANATHVSFIYYETYGSCGAFFPIFRPPSVQDIKHKEGQSDGVIIFTSHFFYRLSERTRKAYRSRELIQEFIATKSTQAAQTDEDGKAAVKFKGGYGFGREKSKNPHVIEIRTYLTDGELSASQRKRVENLDAVAELIADGMYMRDVALSSAIHTYNTPEKAAEYGLRKLELLKKISMEKPMMLMAMIHLAYIRLLQDILDIEIDVPQSAVICHIETDCGVDDLVLKYTDYDGRTATEEGNKQFMEDCIAFYCRCAKKMKLRTVNRESITKRIRQIMESSQEKADEYAKEID